MSGSLRSFGALVDNMKKNVVDAVGERQHTTASFRNPFAEKCLHPRADAFPCPRVFAGAPVDTFMYVEETDRGA